jgi:homoserine O-acetyltransferase
VALGYRIAGALDRRQDNAILLLPWFQGTAVDLLQHVGPGRLADPSRHFVIAAETLGNGRASSPSNSLRQSGWAFPRFTIGDLVAVHIRLITDVLHLASLHAVIGISMGGMEAFEWIATRPDLVANVVSIVGTPATQPRDRARLEAEIERRRASPTIASGWRAACSFKPRTALNEWRLSRPNYVRQAEAIARHDVGRHFGGSLERAAAAVRCRLLAVVSPTDEEVDPAPAVAFARSAGGEVLALDGRCGHQAAACERRLVWKTVDRFISRP